MVQFVLFKFFAVDKLYAYRMAMGIECVYCVCFDMIGYIL